MLGINTRPPLPTAIQGVSRRRVRPASGKVNAVHRYRVVPAVEGPTRETLGYIGTNVRSSSHRTTLSKVSPKSA